jgi:hypothetical protein
MGTRDHWKSFYHEQRPTLADLVVEHRSSAAALEHSPQVRRADTDSGLCAENWCDMPRLGRRRYLVADASYPDSAGQLVAVAETLRDVTDEKRAQAALEQLPPAMA